MDFSLPKDIEDVRVRTRRFVEEEILPVEADRANWDAHDNIAQEPLAVMQALMGRAR